MGAGEKPIWASEPSENRKNREIEKRTKNSKKPAFNHLDTRGPVEANITPTADNRGPYSKKEKWGE